MGLFSIFVRLAWAMLVVAYATRFFQLDPTDEQSIITWAIGMVAIVTVHGLIKILLDGISSLFLLIAYTFYAFVSDRSKAEEGGP